MLGIISRHFTRYDFIGLLCIDLHVCQPQRIYSHHDCTLRAHKFTLDDYNGLYNTNPKLAFLMTLALFSLAGIPPFAGFFSKFFIFAAAFEGGFHLLVFIALINTIISLYYYLKIVKAMYINKSDEPIAAFRSDNYTRASLAICTLGIVVLSIASVVYQSIDKFSFGL